MLHWDSGLAFFARRQRAALGQAEVGVAVGLVNYDRLQ